MGHIVTILNKRKNSSSIVLSSFAQPDSLVSLGNADTGQTWTALIGTWGITSGRAYSVSDTSMDLAVIDAGRSNFTLSCNTLGQIVDISNQRFINVIFRLNDATNYLMTRITGGNLQLYKCITGTLTMITSTPIANVDSQDYLFSIRCEGNNIAISIDGVLKLSYTLTGGELIFNAFTKVGMRLTKNGAPSLPGSADNFRVDPL